MSFFNSIYILYIYIYIYIATVENDTHELWNNKVLKVFS